MRVGHAWRKQLAKDIAALRETSYGPLPIAVSRFLDIELVLTLLRNYFPDEAPEHGWAILNGYRFPAYASLCEEGLRAQAIARLRLPRLLSASAWERDLKAYRALAATPYPLYLIENGRITERATSVLPERKVAYDDVLQNPPPWERYAARYATTGRYRFYINRDQHEVEIPARVATLASTPVPALPRVVGRVASARKRPAISIPLAELRATAQWMREQASPDSVADRPWDIFLDEIELRAPEESRGSSDQVLTLDGLLHLVGRVGVGKSVLFTVLAVYLARRGYRVVLIQGDVASLLREQAIFDELRPSAPELQAVPLIGRSTRLLHLQRLHLAEGLQQRSVWTHDHPGYRMLSIVCPLDGLRREESAMPVGREPCTRLYQPRNGGNSEGSPDSEGTDASFHARLDEWADGADEHMAKSTVDVDGRGSEVNSDDRDDAETPSEDGQGRGWDCPFLPVCPVHTPTRELVDARVWLATPASLIASGPQKPLVPEEVSYAELVMRHADVVLVDEADAVQIQFDDRFAPVEVLVGPGESWLDRVATQVSRQVYRNGRPLVGREIPLDRWLAAHVSAQRAVDRLYTWLRESSATRKWVGRTYFTSERLLERVGRDLRKDGLTWPQFDDTCAMFLANPLGDSSYGPGVPLHPWQHAVHLDLFTVSGVSESSALHFLKRWIREACSSAAHPLTIADEHVEAHAHHLLIALLVGVLNHALHELISEWAGASSVLELDRGAGGLFYTPAEDLARLVPEPPMGAVFGFQYYDPKDQGHGELRFFHVRGVGRALLYRLHDALSPGDGLPGPHVLLASGTSWAPGSWRYHLHEGPHLLLLPRREDRAAETECTFRPVEDPERPGEFLSVSGYEQPDARIRSLRMMIRGLNRSDPWIKSDFDQELERLPEHRRRILLVVGNYDEAEEVGRTLAEERGDVAGEEVLTLVRNQEDEEATWRHLPGRLPRNLLHEMPSRPARFLVAPLQAVERGTNILVGQEAALGSVYFLVRPMPRPGDLHAAVHRLSAFAMERVPTLVDLSAGEAARQLRAEAGERWRRALYEEGTYRGVSPEARTPLLWTQFVMVWQCIGRLLRGGVAARVRFVDAKWAERSAHGEADTEATSMLLGFRRILHERLADADPVQRAITEALYGPAAQAFGQIEGVYDADA